jgi:hypothetical protein
MPCKRWINVIAYSSCCAETSGAAAIALPNSTFNDDANFANNGAQFEINEYSPSSDPTGVCGTAIITQGPVAGSCAALASGEGAGSGSACGVFYQVYINEDGTCDGLNGDPIVQAGRVRLGTTCHDRWGGLETPD